MFIFMLLGMEIFGHKIKFGEDGQLVDLDDPDVFKEAPRPNFDNIYMAFTTIFIVFIGEDWQAVMH